MSINTTYALKEVVGNMAAITEVSDVEMLSNVGADGKLSGTQSGVLSVDTQTGMPLSHETTQSIKGVLSAQGFEVETDIATRIKTSIYEVLN